MAASSEAEQNLPANEQQTDGPRTASTEEVNLDSTPPDVRRRALRALILGSIAAGGAYQLNGWQSQAHGNRSSGAVQSIRTPVLSDVEVKKLLSEPKAPGEAKTPESQTPLNRNEPPR
ncbi:MULTISPECIES: hypothetical protein [unclassified Bradyrhizobium]|uniref:hypothetical protein n=1 Tax=unclassified Bradyrhizobium TaxID=2631580 RepID=UPI002916B8C8|nr:MULTISPECIES: hypothetical protein [unclassified Bradyrhizobium]